MNRLVRTLALGVPLALSQASGQFSINFSFADTFSADEQTAFSNAVDTWENAIAGYQPGISLSGIDITVAGSGSASGPTKVFVQSGFVIADESRVLATPGSIAGLDLATLELFFTREIGSALGMGTLWQANGLYAPGSGQYTGSSALLAYRNEFDPSASFVPVELFSGKSDIYWDEIDEAAGLTGITDSSGRDFGNELMTAWLGPDSSETFISQTSLRSLEDIGFLLSSSPVPEPSSISMIFIAGLGLLRRKR